MSDASKTRKPSKHGGRSRTNGFVLIEVMASVVILSIGLLTAFSGIRSAQSLLERAENTQRATAILDELMSFYALQPMAAVETQRPVHRGEYKWKTEIEPWNSSDVFARDLFDASIDREEASDKASITSTWRRLHITVSWEEHGITRSLEAWQLVELGG